MSRIDANSIALQQLWSVAMRLWVVDVMICSLFSVRLKRGN